MKIIHKDLKKAEIKLQVQNKDDLWYLSHIIEPADLVSGKTIRKIKIGGKEEKQAVTKKAVWLSINIEKTEYNKDVLRVSGTVAEGPEDVPKGSHHTFNVEENTVITIVKPKWYSYQLDKLKESTQKKGKILLAVIDRDTATIALLKNYGYDILTDITGEVEKKAEDVKISTDFYADLVKILSDYVKRHGIEKILIASPGFWKEELKKKMPDELIKISSFATCSNTGKNGINEVLKRDEIKTVLKEERAMQETQMVEKLLEAIAKNTPNVYGLSEVKKAAEMGAIEILLVCDSLLIKMKDEGKYSEIDNIMKLAEDTKAKVMLVSSEHEGGKKLEGLGGIGAILRYEINY